MRVFDFVGLQDLLWEDTEYPELGRPLNAQERLVALRLARYWSPDGQIFPSMENLMQRTQLSERTIRRALRSLEAIRIDGRQLLTTSRRHNKSSVYVFSVCSIPPPPDDSPHINKESRSEGPDAPESRPHWPHLRPHRPVQTGQCGRLSRPVDLATEAAETVSKPVRRPRRHIELTFRGWVITEQVRKAAADEKLGEEALRARVQGLRARAVPRNVNDLEAYVLSLIPRWARWEQEASEASDQAKTRESTVGGTEAGPRWDRRYVDAQLRARIERSGFPVEVVLSRFVAEVLRPEWTEKRGNLECMRFLARLQKTEPEAAE